MNAAFACMPVPALQLAHDQAKGRALHALYSHERTQLLLLGILQSEAAGSTLQLMMVFGIQG